MADLRLRNAKVSARKSADGKTVTGIEIFIPTGDNAPDAAKVSSTGETMVHANVGGTVDVAGQEYRLSVNVLRDARTDAERTAMAAAREAFKASGKKTSGGGRAVVKLA